jgi:hypothetical protein
LTYPQQPYQPPQPGYPAQTGYPQAGPQYAPPPQPQFQPPQYQQPVVQGGYAPQAQPGYGQVPADVPRATVEDFWNQPAGGALGLKFEHIGTEYLCTVSRTVTNADIQPQTKLRPRPGEDPIARHPDGRVKQQMLVPVSLQPTPVYPEGQATWYVKGADQAELVRAMQAAGCVPDENGNPPVPQTGDVIHIRYTHDRPGRAGMSPTKIRQVTYTRAQDVQQGQFPGPAQVQPQQYAPPAAAPAATPYSPAPSAGTMTQPAYNTNQAYQQATGQPMPQQPAFDPVQAQQFQQQYQQPVQQYPGSQPVPGPTAPPVQPGPPPGAPPTVSASPSSGTPANWPADVPFIPGLTPEQARTAFTMKLAMAPNGQPQQ